MLEIEDIHGHVYPKHEFLEATMVSTMVPLQVIAMICQLCVLLAIYFFRSLGKYPSTLFRYLLWSDFLYGILFAVRWLHLFDAHVGYLCNLEAAIDNGFHMSSLYFTTAILGCHFFKMYYLKRVPDEWEKRMTSVFWFMALLAFAAAFMSPVSNRVGWCVVDSVGLFIKQVMWYIMVTTQLMILVPTVYLIYSASKKRGQSVSWDVYARVAALAVSQSLLITPLLVAEGLSAFRKDLTHAHIQALAILFPVAHLINVAVVGSRVYDEVERKFSKTSNVSTSTFDRLSNSYDSSVKGSSVGGSVGGSVGSLEQVKVGEDPKQHGKAELNEARKMRRVKAKKKKKKTLREETKVFDAKSFIRNTSAILLSPLIGLAVVGAINISRSGYDSALARDATDTVPLSRAIVAFVHETQKERGYSQVYMNHADPPSVLVNLYQKWNDTDLALPGLEEAIANFDYAPVKETSEFVMGVELVLSIGDIRYKTENLLWSASDSFNTYTWMNGNLSACQVLIALALKLDTTDYAVLSYLALTRYISEINREIVSGSYAIMGGKFRNPEHYSEFVGIILQSDSYYHDIYKTFLEPELQDFIHEHEPDCVASALAQRDHLLTDDPAFIENLTLTQWREDMDCKYNWTLTQEKEMIKWINYKADYKMIHEEVMIVSLTLGFAFIFVWTSFLIFTVIFSSNSPVEILGYMDRTCFGKKFTFGTQIALATMLPTVIISTFFVITCNRDMTDLQFYAHIKDQFEIVGTISDLMEAFNLERRMAVAYYDYETVDDYDCSKSSVGCPTRDELLAQFLETDEHRQYFLDKTVNIETALQTSQSWDTLMIAEETINIDRGLIWDFKLGSTDEVEDIYDTLIERHMDLYFELARVARRNNFYYELLAYTIYLPGKERSGAQRALGVAPWNDGMFHTAEQFTKWAYYKQTQRVWLMLGKVYFTEEQLKYEEDHMTTPDVDRFVYWESVLNTYNPATITQVRDDEEVTGPIWFDTCTIRIDLMLEVSFYLDSDLLASTSGFARTSTFFFVLTCAVIISAFVFSDNFTTMVMWRLVRLREMAREMKFASVKKKKGKR